MVRFLRGLLLSFDSVHGKRGREQYNCIENHVRLYFLDPSHMDIIRRQVGFEPCVATLDCSALVVQQLPVLRAPMRSAVTPYIVRNPLFDYHAIVGL